MFSKLKESGIACECAIAVAFDCFVHICDTAGALGHVNNESSLSYIEQTHQGKQAVIKACNVLSDSNKTELDAYDSYLKIRANWLGLDIKDRTERALTRMGAMLRLFTPEEGTILKKAMKKLPSKTQTQIIEQLDIRKGEELKRTPTYMPAVLVNLANNPQLGATKEERISKAVLLGLPFLARVLEAHKRNLLECKANPNIPLNFNNVAGIAKIDPDALNGKYAVDSEGNVCVEVKKL